MKPWYRPTIRWGGGVIVMLFILWPLHTTWLDTGNELILIPATVGLVAGLGLLVTLAGLPYSHGQNKLIGISGTVVVGMCVLWRIASGWIDASDTVVIVLASLFVGPFIGLIVGFVRLAQSHCGWKRRAAIAEATLWFLMTALVVLFIGLGVLWIVGKLDEI